MDHPLSSPGSRLRETRKSLGLTLRDVARGSVAIARGRGNNRFQLFPTTLHSIETNGQTPTLHHLYSLARVHGLDFGKVLSWYLGTSLGPDS